MVKPKSVSPRKQPIQARSRQMMADILEAATRVLTEDGLSQFNTNRVAEVAGVSVGSLYQYFPNKEALLLQLQEQEATQTWAELEAILENDCCSARDRLDQAIRHFFRSERAERDLQQGLQNAAVFFEQMPQQEQLEALAEQTLQTLLRGALPDLERSQLQFKVRYVITAVSAIAARVAQRNIQEPELSRWSQSCSDMLCNYLELPSSDSPSLAPSTLQPMPN